MEQHISNSSQPDQFGIAVRGLGCSRRRLALVLYGSRDVLFDGEKHKDR